jgi:hypothetical protein
MVLLATLGAASGFARTDHAVNDYIAARNDHDPVTALAQSPQPLENSHETAAHPALKPATAPPPHARR